MIYCNAKKCKPPENDVLAEALGWTDIKSWGGRGIRGIAPRSTRHESLPRLSYDITSLINNIRRARSGIYVRLEITPNGRVIADVGDFSACGDLDDLDFPNSVLAVAAYQHFTNKRKAHAPK